MTCIRCGTATRGTEFCRKCRAKARFERGLMHGFSSAAQPVGDDNDFVIEEGDH